jgi:cell division protein FtsX
MHVPIALPREAALREGPVERGLFDAVAAYNLSTADITDRAEPERVQALRADEEYFGAIGTRPLLGRFFTPEDNVQNGPRVVVLSHKLWTRRFGRDPHVVGKPIELFGVPATIIGIARPDAIWPGNAELVRPLGTGGPPDANMLRRDNHAYRALARLRPGVTIEQAQAKLTLMGTAIAEREANRAGTNWKLHALDAYVAGTSLRQTLWVLLGAALLVLAIACVNVANLLLARGIAREREIAVRAALGASRWRIASQFLAESALLSAAGGLYLPRVFLRENQPDPPASADTQAGWSVVQPGYFATMGIPIVEGRAFTAQDAANSTQVIIISRAMAKEMFPDGRPLGRRIRSWRDENRYREIVGVVGDLRYNGLAADISNNVYVPHTQRPWNALTVVVRTHTDPLTMLRSVRDAIWLVDKKLPLASVQTMQQVMDTEMARPRLTMFLLVLFGLAALALAAIGTYGIVAYSVTQRTREIGIRMALGALRTRVVAMVVWKALRLAAVGLVCGCAAALALTRVLASLLFEVNATDPAVFGAAALLLLGVVVAAACIPAYRASRVDPVTTLRCE